MPPLDKVRPGKRVLIAFIRNLIKGQVKRRIAVKIGDEKALQLYEILLNYLKKLLSSLNSDIHCVLYFTDWADDKWPERFEKEVQSGSDLGECMHNAISNEFSKGAASVCIIGSDIPDLSRGIVLEGFNKLDSHDMVIGPALDGGYYLLGLKNAKKTLFQDMEWGSDQVFDETISRIESLAISCAVLETLSDVDELEDIPPKFRKLINLE